MIDIHTHIIPHIDDGSSSIEASLQQLRQMAEGGIRRAYLTSHYLRGHYQYTRDEYDLKLQELLKRTAAESIKIDLQPGFEIFLQPDILADIKKHHLTLGNSSYILVESDLNGLPNDFYSNIFPLLRAGYKPILAHAERYVSIMRKPSLAASLSHRNIYIQTNAGSLLGVYGDKVKETAWTLVNNGWTHFVASDDHVRGEYYSLPAAAQAIETQIDNHAMELLCEVYPAALATNEPIPYQYVHVFRPHHKRKSWFKRLFG